MNWYWHLLASIPTICLAIFLLHKAFGASSAPAFTLIHGEVTGRLYGDVWEAELDGKVFRSYSKVFVSQNRWVTQDGQVASQKQAARMNAMVQEARQQLTNRSETSVW